MNDKSSLQNVSYRTLQLMTELERDENLSQRELAGRLGVAVGLVNSYLKNLATKGLLRIKNYPRNRYSYLLTPKGVAEKSRLAYQHLHYFNDLYTIVRRDYLALFQKLKDTGVSAIAFCGVDEVAEIAYLSLKEAGLELTVVTDVENKQKDLFGHQVVLLPDYLDADFESAVQFVITSLKRRDQLNAELLRLGVSENLISVVGQSNLT